MITTSADTLTEGEDAMFDEPEGDDNFLDYSTLDGYIMV